MKKERILEVGSIYRLYYCDAEFIGYDSDGCPCFKPPVGQCSYGVYNSPDFQSYVIPFGRDWGWKKVKQNKQ